MLRGVCLENFVTFQEKQVIQFTEHESPQIFVGENWAGKTAMMEGIRRCLSSTTSTNWSSNFDDDKPGYFVCKYDTRKCSESILKDVKEIFSGVIRQTNTRLYYKFISTRSQLLIDRYRDESAHHDPRKPHHLDSTAVTTEKVQNVFDALNNNNTLLIDHIVDQEFNETSIADSTVENILNILEKYITMTFPMRSIRPLQWTKSKSLNRSKRTCNYLEGSKRSEIIRYFLEHDNEFDLKAERDNFTDLTGHDDIKFRLQGATTEESGIHHENTSIVVESTRGTHLPEEEFALLKLPEGVLEAKNTSILMSSKHFLTLVLDEPDRGMHPQMIERMLAIIKKESRNKIVVLCTHSPCFIHPLTISRLVIFKLIRTSKTDDTKRDRTETISGNVIAKFNVPGERDKSLALQPSVKTLRILTRDHLADLIFAKRILFCEGDSDYLFLTALKEKMMEISPCVERVLRLIDDSNIDTLKDTLQRISASIQIINMNGWNNAEMMHTLCVRLKIDDHYFVCDKDAIVEENDMKKENRWMCAGKYMQIEKDFKQGKLDWEGVRGQLRIQCNCFTWRDGTIEDMAISLLRSDTNETKCSRSAADERPFDRKVSWSEKGQVIDALKQQHVRLPISRWKEKRQNIEYAGKKRKLRDGENEKLFLSYKVTQENIIKSTEIFLNACDSRWDDLVQFVRFISQMPD